MEKGKERDYTHYCIGQAGGKLPYSEHLHAQRLGPDKERRLLPERLEVNLHVEPVAGYQHFTGTLGKINLVPVKKPYASNSGDEEQGAQNHQADVHKQDVTFHLLRKSKSFFAAKFQTKTITVVIILERR